MVTTDASKTLQGLGINPEALLRRLADLEGRVTLAPAELAKAWCFCDANVFLQYALFDQVDWAKELGRPAVVLVVPTAVRVRWIGTNPTAPTRASRSGLGRCFHSFVNTR
jgi:hypothetical protein